MPLSFSLVYGFGVAISTVIFRAVFRSCSIGLERMPRQDGLLIVSNHISFADPAFVATFSPRSIHFMAMVELFNNPVLRICMRALRVIPVNRSKVDHRAAREALRRLRAGHCVAIYPEGGIRLGKDSVLGGDPIFKPGAGAIARLSHAAVVPVIIRDTRKTYHWRNWLRREKMNITFGYPFCLWTPKNLSGDERRKRAEETLCAQLMKTVELD